MGKSSKKLAVLSVLENNQNPIQLPDILKILGPTFAERSVRRWLNEMAHEELIEKKGKKRATYYQFKEKVERHFVFSSEAKESISYVQQPIFNRKPIPYNREWLNGYQPNETFYLGPYERDILSIRGHPEPTPLLPAGTYARKIYNRLLIDLSYNSSRLEGNTYSLIDTEKLIIEGISSQGKLDEESIMILNHKDAIRYLVDNAANMEINFNSICTLHYLLSDGLVPVQFAGKVKNHSVRIGASTYLTLDDPKELEIKLQLICKKASAIMNPYEQSLFLLSHLAYLQAFTDVNKRTSRISANIPLIKQNLYPLAFNDIGKNDYIFAMMALYELNDIRPLAELYVFSYLRTCEQYDGLISTLGVDEIRVLFRKERRDILRAIIINGLTERKIAAYIQAHIKNIPMEYRDSFVEDVYEDLNEINAERIGGLGVTVDQLQEWLKAKKNL